MTTMIMMDADHTPAGVKRRLREEFARHGIESDTTAAERYNVPQQWLSRRMTGETDWKVWELEEFCRGLGLSYVYVATGIRPLPPPLDYGGPVSDKKRRPPNEVSQLNGRRRRSKPVGEDFAPSRPAEAA
jgi:hypothetical protein